MGGEKGNRKPQKTNVESQDDIGYLTGKRTRTEEEKQIRTPVPRRASRLRGGRTKEVDSDS
jgi:hypothetical protein